MAIAAAKLFNRAVEAVDNDPYAITNANDNVALNHLSHLIKPSTTPIENLTTPYNLILANLYGEVLVQLAPEVTRLALLACIAIISGITELVRAPVAATLLEVLGCYRQEDPIDYSGQCDLFRHAQSPTITCTLFFLFPLTRHHAVLPPSFLRRRRSGIRDRSRRLRFRSLPIKCRANMR